MTHVLHTFVTTLLSSTPDVHLDKVTVEQDTVWLELTATAPHARCPCCAVSSSSIHSRYQRHLTDLPWGMRAVRIQLTVRKFLCRNRDLRASYLHGARARPRRAPMPAKPID